MGMKRVSSALKRKPALKPFMFNNRERARKTKIDLLSLKSEIASYIRNGQAAKRKDDNSAAEVQDMLMDVTQMIEEGHCNPFRPKKL
jgi:hypothetical protein